MPKQKFEWIAPEEVEKSRRGRTPEYDDTLVELFKKIDDTKAVKLTYLGPVVKEERPAVRYLIQKNWHHVRDDKPKIIFTSDGTPQVLKAS